MVTVLASGEVDHVLELWSRSVSVHNDVMQNKFDPVTLTFDLENQ
jgi:hypothetical protein